MTQTVAHPIGVRDLPDGTHPCAICGTPVDGPTIPMQVTRFKRDELGAGWSTSTVPGPFAECDTCTARRDLAAGIVDANPSLRRLGSPRQIKFRLAAALVAIDGIGQPIPPVEAWTATAVADALARFAGNRFTWSLHHPVAEGAEPDTCASAPWLWVEGDAIAETRTAYIEWCVDRLPPRPIPSPTGGCALCGVATSMGRRPSEAWQAVTSGALTGGQLCTTCSPAYTSNVPLAVSIDAAVLAHLDGDRLLRRKGPHPPRLAGVRPWADTGRAPSRRPWEHVDLSAVLRTLQNGTW